MGDVVSGVVTLVMVMMDLRVIFFVVFCFLFIFFVLMLFSFSLFIYSCCCLSFFSFCSFIIQHDVTVGVEFAIRIVNIGGKKVKLQIWDTVSPPPILPLQSIPPTYLAPYYLQKT